MNTISIQFMHYSIQAEKAFSSITSNWGSYGLVSFACNEVK